jgi:class 3 adenylate cyclase
MEKGEEGEKGVFRMDFIKKPSLTFDGENMYFEIILIPDPERYDVIEKNGEISYHDKYTNTRISKHLVDELLKDISTVTPFENPPKENNAKKYLIERRKEIKEHWQEKYRPQKKDSELSSIFESLRGSDSRIVVFYVDIEGSTRLSSQLSSDENTKVVKTFIMQMSMIIDNYRGYVLKTVGDAVIGIWIAEKNFTTMCDNSIQAAMTIRGMVEDVLNPLLTESGMPEIGFHIGIDIGKSRIENVGASNIHVTDDLIGYTMNRAAKIQARAGHNQILIGRIFFKLLHNKWQKYCKKKDMDDSWQLRDPEREEIYAVYEYNGQWDIDIDSENGVPKNSENV